MASDMVVWSGGADSTYLLNHYATVSCEEYPVRAVTVIRHPYLCSDQLAMQNKARKNYLKFAKSKGYHVSCETVAISGSFSFKHSDVSAQMLMWLTAIAPCVGEGDTVCFAYIKEDGMWHHKQKFVDAFHSLCAVKGVSAELKFPFEWTHKYQILDRLKANRVPKLCYWTCDHPVSGKACGKCEKCLEIARAKFECDFRKKVGSYVE